MGVYIFYQAGALCPYLDVFTLNRVISRKAYPAGGQLVHYPPGAQVHGTLKCVMPRGGCCQ